MPELRRVSIDLISSNNLNYNNDLAIRIADAAQAGIPDLDIGLPVLEKGLLGRYRIVLHPEILIAAKWIGLTSVLAIVAEAGENINPIPVALITSSTKVPRDNPIEMAETAKDMVERTGSQHRAARELGWTRSQLVNRLRLLRLPPEIQRAIVDGKITEGHGRALSYLDNDIQGLVLRLIADNGLTVREAEDIAAGRKRIEDIAATPAAIKSMMREWSEQLGCQVLITQFARKGVVQLRVHNEQRAHLIAALSNAGCNFSVNTESILTVIEFEFANLDQLNLVEHALNLKS